MMKHDDTAATATSPPNIILVIADDLGWNNVGWHGNAEVQTPSLDNLLKEGIEIDRMYLLRSTNISENYQRLMTAMHAHA
jgi:arylsulfatase B